MISITNAAKEPHITPLQDSMWHRGMAGIDSCVFNFFENFAAEVSSNNSVKIRSGIGMIQGRYFCLEPSTYDEVTIANGTQGEKRKDLIVCRWTVDEEQKVQSGDWVVIQGTPTTGTPAAPSYTTGDLDAGDLIADMPFYEVTLDGINVTGVVRKFTSLGGIGKFPNPLPISKGGTGATTSAAALAALGGVGMKKVWTNPSPTSEFKPRKLTITDDDYDAIDMVFLFSTNYAQIVGTLRIRLNSTRRHIFNATWGSNATRGVTPSKADGKIILDIETGNNYVFGSTGSANNNAYAIPLEAYGVKGVV